MAYNQTYQQQPYGQPSYPNHGQPPAQQWGPPPGQPGYGAQPPPPGQYAAQGYPHQNTGAYGVPGVGANQGYGPPPSQVQPPYGGHGGHSPAPPQPQYGGYSNQPPHQAHHQPPQAGGYGQPPPPGPPRGYDQPQGQEFWYLGTKLAVDPIAPLARVPPSIPTYDPTADAETIYKATKGFGTNENAIHRVLCMRSAEQIQVLGSAYKSRYGKDLATLMKKETSGNHERVLVGLTLSPLEYDVELLHEACAGVGTKETTLTEMVIGRSPSDLMLLRAAYEKRFKKSFDQMIAGELSFKTKDAFNIALQGRHQDNGYVDPNMLHHDVQQLANNMRLGFTDELLVASIIFARSPLYLNALCNQFKQTQRSSLTKQIKQHFSGHLQDALLYAVEGGKRDPQGIWRDAKMLEKAMAGMGTKDHQLVYRLIRAHWDKNRFQQIKNAYHTKYKRTLTFRVKGETSGHYEDALVAIIEGR